MIAGAAGRDATAGAAGRSATKDLATRAYDGIRAAILNASFEPGQPLQESYLAGWLGISRTPVREAIKRLQTEGLVESHPSRGVVVAQVSISDIENAYLVLEVLEGLSSRLAAERLTSEGATTLRGLMANMQAAAQANDLDRWVKTDGELHEAVRDAAGNPKLSQMAPLVYSVVERVRNIYLREGTEDRRLLGVTDEHAGLVDAILAGQPERAEDLARQLFRQARLDNVRLLRQWVAPIRRVF